MLIIFRDGREYLVKAVKRHNLHTITYTYGDKLNDEVVWFFEMVANIAEIKLSEEIL